MIKIKKLSYEIFTSKEAWVPLTYTFSFFAITNRYQMGKKERKRDLVATWQNFLTPCKHLPLNNLNMYSPVLSLFRMRDRHQTVSVCLQEWLVAAWQSFLTPSTSFKQLKYAHIFTNLKVRFLHHFASFYLKFVFLFSLQVCDTGDEVVMKNK